MLYYYAHTGHKIGLERARRGVAVMNAMQQHGIEVQLLVNDFRAGVALKEQCGIRDYVTLETIQDIDAIAQMGDSVIIDSNEDDHGRLVKYVADFKQVWRFAHDENDRSIHGEILFREGCSDKQCEEAVIVDACYFEEHPKEERVLLFLRDYDHDKTILNHHDFFSQFNMELLLGNYFFVKYEDDLAKLFSTLHEPEEYVELITGSTTVVTASSQTALEAKASGAKVIFLNIGSEPIYSEKVLLSYGIHIVNGFDLKALQESLHKEDTWTNVKTLKPFDPSRLLKEL